MRFRRVHDNYFNEGRPATPRATPDGHVWSVDWAFTTCHSSALGHSKQIAESRGGHIWNVIEHTRWRAGLLALVAVSAMFLTAPVCSASEIHKAAGGGDLETARRLLNKNPQLVNEIGTYPSFSWTEWFLSLEYKAKGIVSWKQGGTPLHYAVSRGDMAMCELLVAKGAEVNAEAEDGSTALFLAMELGYQDIFGFLLENGARQSVFTAAGVGDVSTLRRLLDKDSTLVRTKDYDGSTALHWAAKRGKPEAVKVLLEAGADPNRGDGWTPLHLACRFGFEEVTRFLLDGGARVDPQDKHGQRPLHVAARYGQRGIVRLLLGQGADVNLRDTYWQDAPLHDAAQSGDKDTVRILLQHGAEPNAVNGDKETSLHIAAEKGLTEVVAILLAHGADVRVQDEKGLWALHKADLNGHHEVVRLVLGAAQPGDIFGAAGTGQLSKAKTLVEGRKEVLGDRDPVGMTPLHYGAGWGTENIIKYLLAHGAQPGSRDKWGNTPLHRAAFYGRKNNTEVLLNSGARIDATDNKGMMPLHEAAARGQIACVDVLLSRGGDIRAADKYGKTALHRAAAGGHKAAVQTLLEGGADVNARDKSGKTALHLATRGGHDKVVELLLAYGAPADVATEDGWTPLHAAAWSSGDAKVVEMLLEKGAKVNARYGDKRQTPLHRATEAQVVRLLLAHGADVSAKDSNGRTPWRLAAERRRPEVLTLLRTHMGME